MEPSPGRCDGGHPSIYIITAAAENEIQRRWRFRKIHNLVRGYTGRFIYTEETGPRRIQACRAAEAVISPPIPGTRAARWAERGITVE